MMLFQGTTIKSDIENIKPNQQYTYLALPNN